MKAKGWLFDLYASGDRLVLWFITDDGERLRLEDSFNLHAYLEGEDEDVAACVRTMERTGNVRGIAWVERVDFWTGKARRVFAFDVISLESWRRALDRYAEKFPGVSWHNADLLIEQCYNFARDTFPLMRCIIKHDGERLLGLVSDDDLWDTDYCVPPFRIAELSGKGTLHGSNRRLDSLTLTCEGRTLVWDDPREMLAGLQSALDNFDPDILLTDHGDSFLLPLLYWLAQKTKFRLRLDRDDPPDREIKTEGRSYFSYGRILYQAPEYALRGRWHIDRRNSFALSHDGMDGLFEVARLSRIPVQRIARRSIGTGISSIQLDLAWREGFLIPWKKTEPEGWKTARQLLKTDRGGLVYAPEIGFHENVVELDFVSMYPSIMSRLNVSPETVNCPCCNNGIVPEIGYTICERRKGLVARALGPIIEKRIRYKVQRKAANVGGDKEGYARADQRQDALKWMLVCCFGYLGYRNARFGRIEAHEAVSAYSREMLLRARELCEDHGWHFLHGNVDCLWIVKPGFQHDEVPALCAEIENVTGLPIAIEGIYRWLAFLPSRELADRPVPSRYFGAFLDGSLKYRGIECRRHDYPPFIKEAQLEVLRWLASASNTAAFRAQLPEFLRRVADYESLLMRGEVPLEELTIRQALSQDLDEYSGNGPQSLAAQQALNAGLAIHAGESLSYIITSATDKDRGKRVRLVPLIDFDTAADPLAYIKLLRRAMNTLLWPTGTQLDEEHILPRAIKVRPANPQCDLFEGVFFA